MNQEIICSGFGGQGVLTTGLLLAYAGHEKSMNVTWYPSYGAEMRGGTANCNVKLSSNPDPSEFVHLHSFEKCENCKLCKEDTNV